MKRLVAALLALLCAAGAAAQTVSMGGSLGSNALLVIDGKPRSVAVGATVDGIRLVSVTGNDAVVEIKGKRVLLRLGDAQVNLGGKASEGGGKQIVLTAQSGGHFHANGAINGQSVRFMVDTGATMVAMDKYEAERLGLDYKNGRRGISRTANGDVAVYADEARLGAHRRRPGLRRRCDRLAGADAVHPARQQLPDALPDEARERRHDARPALLAARERAPAACRRADRGNRTIVLKRGRPAPSGDIDGPRLHPR